ncbi:MAG: hypothetical protein GF390_02810 [Candidatus Pacebacteria bacterium]|nr:hypothetical protein [Candidatus Paceibacterota bacterium]
MAKYLFQLGTTPKLSLAELQAVSNQSQVHCWWPQLVTQELTSDQQAQEIFALLGGAVKLLKIEQQLTQLTDSAIYQALVDYLLTQAPAEQKIVFSLTSWGATDLSLQAGELKNLLKQQGRKARYLEAKRYGLSAAVLLHQQVIELYVVFKDNRAYLARTLAVQDIDDWTKRDRHKPYANRKKGMLPPKLARIMVNLAIGSQTNQLIYDPFCGTGTILIEAMLHNCQVIGSDLDRQAIQGTGANLEWAKKTYQLDQAAQVLVQDATQVKLANLPGKVDAIVTEPFLGQPKPKPQQLPNIFKGLSKLYLGVFKNWQQLLKPQAKVVMVFPRVELNRQVFELSNLIDKLGSLGYTLEVEPLVYSRPQAVVKREIRVFQYKG